MGIARQGVDEGEREAYCLASSPKKSCSTKWLLPSANISRHCHHL